LKNARKVKLRYQLTSFFDQSILARRCGSAAQLTVAAGLIVMPDGPIAPAPAIALRLGEMPALTD
jgi:hypothetical protein